MPARLTAWLDAAAQWGPAIPVAIVFSMALIEAVILPRRVWAKGAWVVAVLACGALASADLHVQQQRSQLANQTAAAANQTAADNEIAALHGLWGQWDAVSRTLPAANEAPPTSFDTVEDALVSLSFQVAEIDRQIIMLRKQSKGRSIDGETAAKLADYL